MQVEAVFFDAAGTLIFANPPVGEVYARALRRAGVSAEGEEVQKRFEETWRRLRRQHAPACGHEGRAAPYGSTEAEGKDWWRRVVRESFKPFGLPDDFEGAFLYLWDHFASGAAWRVYPDVMPTFDALKRIGKRIGLISNWDVRLPRLLDELGLRQHIRWAVMSYEVGVEKPDPLIFSRAAEASGLPPHRLLHVGDSYEEDILGARNARMQAIWLRRGPEAQPAGECYAAADIPLVSSLLDILSLIS